MSNRLARERITKLQTSQAALAESILVLSSQVRRKFLAPKLERTTSNLDVHVLCARHRSRVIELNAIMRLWRQNMARRHVLISRNAN